MHSQALRSEVSNIVDGINEFDYHLYGNMHFAFGVQNKLIETNKHTHKNGTQCSKMRKVWEMGKKGERKEEKRKGKNVM